jgi:hypothetical protein
MPFSLLCFGGGVGVGVVFITCAITSAPIAIIAICVVWLTCANECKYGVVPYAIGVK